MNFKMCAKVFFLVYDFIILLIVKLGIALITSVLFVVSTFYHTTLTIFPYGFEYFKYSTIK